VLLISLYAILLVLSGSTAIAPERVAIIPKLGELGAHDDAFLPESERLPEHRFANPWVEFGQDWLLKPGLGVAWSNEETDRWIVLKDIMPSTFNVKTIISAEEVAVQPISAHLVQLPGRSRWRDLLASPFTILPNGRKEAFGASYDLVHWIRNQHAFLSARADAVGPKGILISVYSSRREAMDALVTGEIDALDDLSSEERKRIHVTGADVQVFNRRSNELLYLLWNPGFPGLAQAETRDRLEMLMDKRRIASRTGSRAAWATSCPVPATVPGAWSSGSHQERVAQGDTVLPDSLVLWSEHTDVAVAAGIEVARDMERHGVKVSRFVAPANSSPDLRDSTVWSAWIGSYRVSPASLLPPVPPGCQDILAPSRAVATLEQMPSVSAWRELSQTLRSNLDTERSITFLCWLPRWGAVSSRWLIPEPGAGCLLNDVTDWSAVPHFRSP
jgi:hypothetical protein